MIITETYMGYDVATGEFVVVYHGEKDNDWYIQFWDKEHLTMRIEEVNDVDAWRLMNGNSADAIDAL